MGHTYVIQNIHCVFSTQGRVKVLNPGIRERLWPYMKGICREHNLTALEAGGVSDHVHLLLRLPPIESLSKAMQAIKGVSSKWINETFFPAGPRFRWQEGFGGFSIGASGVERTVDYIRGQERHHKRQSFEAEFIGFLKRQGIEYDERYVFD